MAQAVLYFLLLTSVLPLYQASHCPSRQYCPVGLDCRKTKNFCTEQTCSGSPNGSMFCKKDIYVSFTEISYTVSEDDGLVQPVLMLSEPLSCCNFHVWINVTDITAKNNLDYKYTSPKRGQMRVVIPAGHSRVSFDLTILDDMIIEDIESFRLSIIDVSLPHNVSVGSIESTTVYILDNDYACVDFERSTYSVRESDRSGLSVNLILSKPTAIDIPISISSVDIETSVVDTLVANGSGCLSGSLQDVVFVIDTSGSIGADNFQLIRQFTANVTAELIRKFQNTEVGVILFDSSAHIEFNLQAYTSLNSILSAISRLPYTGEGTNTAGALELLLQTARNGALGLRDNSLKTVIVITDGESNDKPATISAARALHASNIFNVYSVGVGGYDLTELQEIASRPGFVFFTDTFTSASLQQLGEELEQLLCKECDYEHGPYSVVFKDENKRSGAQRVTLKINIIDDDMYEENERFNLVINTPSHYRISRCPPYRSTVTITNDESLIQMNFEKTSMTVDEHVGTISPVLKLSKPSPCCLSVLVELIDRTATGRGIDYDYPPPETPRYYEYTFSAGETCATPYPPIPIVDDKESKTDENERFEIHLVENSVPYGTRFSGRDFVSVTIKDNDINLCYVDNECKINENEDELEIKMFLDESPQENHVVTIMDTPQNASDFYSRGPYNLTIKKYQRNVVLTIPINASDPGHRCTGDRVFSLTIECPSPPRGIQPCPGQSTIQCVIEDNERGSVKFAYDHYEIRKNQMFPTKPQLEISGSPTYPFDVHISDKEIDGDSEIGRATENVDYRSRSYTEYYIPKDRKPVKRSLTVFPIDDDVVEDNESYNLVIDETRLRSRHPCICAYNTTTNVTIVNDDYAIVKIDTYQGNPDKLIFTRGLKFDTEVYVFYDGFSVNQTVYSVDPSDDYDPPEVILMANYTTIKLEVHPAVYDYVEIQVPGIISKDMKKILV